MPVKLVFVRASMPVREIAHFGDLKLEKVGEGERAESQGVDLLQRERESSGTVGTFWNQKADAVVGAKGIVIQSTRGNVVRRSNEESEQNTEKQQRV